MYVLAWCEVYYKMYVFAWCEVNIRCTFSRGVRCI